MTLAAPTFRDYAALAAILLVAAVLRIVGLDGPLWYDEILTLDTHILLPWQDLMQSYSMNHHYLHNLQAKAAIDIFGYENWVVRLPSMVFGTASIAAAWWLARDIAGTRIAHLVAALLAVSYHHIWFSQNARGYAELAFWGTLGMVFFLRGLDRPSIGIWLAYAVTLVLATFTHLTGLFLFAAQGIVWLIALGTAGARGTIGRSLVTMPALGYCFGLILTVLVYLPVLGSLSDTVGAVSETSAVDVMSEYQSPLWTMTEAVRSAVGSLGPLVSLLAGSVVFLSVLGGIVSRRGSPWFGLVVLAHICMTLALLGALGMRIWPRFFFVDIAFLMILIVLGVRAVCNAMALGRPCLAKWFFGAASVAMLVLSVGLATRNYTAAKQNLSGAFDLVETIREDADRVYAVGPAAKVFQNHFGADWQQILEPAEFDAAVGEPGSLWVVVAFPQRNFRKIPRLLDDLDGPLAVYERFPGTLGDGAVLILRRD